MENEAALELRKFIIENGSKILRDTIKFHLKNHTDFANTFSNRMHLRSLSSRIKKLKNLTDADAYLVGYMLMVYSQESGSKRAEKAFDYFNDRILKRLDNMFREE